MKLHCKSCGYEWQSRVAKPKACPDCKSRRYNPNKIATVYNHSCKRCGYEWKSVKANPKCCNRCKRFDWYKTTLKGKGWERC